ncbi:hypothetical protein N7474_007225 [Penicillium riverlandense]|uniref:uncharacterized protein n=1 Tax=Penicillium riverlandense TaxID=1903569 RepID=UPI002548D182|nr:uncharacterized protein N7474_007225 [Penicillium riverlandense]KAJ5815448.1 hypothetical protein N7474_007225 [Penicillium riverlandense]
MSTPLPDPPITKTPTRHPTTCLAVSTPLLSTLRRILPQKPLFTLSIGSGAGLLEALLAQHDHDHDLSATIAVEGVEVGSAVNRYIPEQDMHVVPGAWAVSGRALAAAAWLFVYPRDVGLVARYLNISRGRDGERDLESGSGGGGRGEGENEGNDPAVNVQLVVWLGPRVDWPDYENVFTKSLFSELAFLGEAEGLAPYEVGVVARRRVS